MKLSIFADDMIVYVENSKKSEKKDREREKEKEKSFLELTSSAKSWSTRSTHKNQSHFRVLAMASRKPKFKMQCHLQALKKLKYLDVKLTKYNQDQYAEHDKTLMKNSKKI